MKRVASICSMAVLVALVAYSPAGLARTEDTQGLLQRIMESMRPQATLESWGQLVDIFRDTAKDVGLAPKDISVEFSVHVTLQPESLEFQKDPYGYITLTLPATESVPAFCEALEPHFPVADGWIVRGPTLETFVDTYQLRQVIRFPSLREPRGVSATLFRWNTSGRISLPQIVSSGDGTFSSLQVVTQSTNRLPDSWLKLLQTR